MILIGCSMTAFPIRDLFTDRRLILFSLLQLLLVPLAAMLIIRAFFTDPNLLGVCLVMLATPVGSMTAMMAELYGGDQVPAGNLHGALGCCNPRPESYSWRVSRKNVVRRDSGNMILKWSGYIHLESEIFQLSSMKTRRKIGYKV